MFCNRSQITSLSVPQDQTRQQKNACGDRDRHTATRPLTGIGTATPSTLKQPPVHVYNTSPWFPCTLSSIYHKISQISVLRALKYKFVHKQNYLEQT